MVDNSPEPSRRNTGVLKDQFGVHVENVPAVIPPPEDATAPRMAWKRGDEASNGFIVDFDDGDKAETVAETELARRSPSNGNIIMSRDGIVRS